MNGFEASGIVGRRRMMARRTANENQNGIRSSRGAGINSPAF
jgi:hypothetical protein